MLWPASHLDCSLHSGCRSPNSSIPSVSLNMKGKQQMKERTAFFILLLVCISVVLSGPVSAFHISTHRRITMEALHRRGVTYNGVAVSFSTDATRAIDSVARD